MGQNLSAEQPKNQQTIAVHLSQQGERTDQGHISSWVNLPASSAHQPQHSQAQAVPQRCSRSGDAPLNEMAEGPAPVRGQRKETTTQ